MEFYIEAKYFKHEFGGTWRGRAMDATSTRELNFKLPLPASATQVRAELATVYELARTLPTFVSPGMDVNIIVTSEEVKEKILADDVILEMMGDVDLTIEVASGSTTP